MKLSQTLSALLLGSALVLTGCGGSSSSSDSTTDDSTGGNDSQQESTLSAAGLAGKSLYLYGYNENGLPGDSRITWVISEDGTTVDAVEDGEAVVEDAIFTVNGNTISVTFEEDGNSETVAYEVAAIDESGLYVFNIDDVGDDSRDPYPEFGAFAEQADDGAQVLTDALGTVLPTNAAISAHPWYSVDVAQWGAECWSIDTFNANGTISSTFVEDGEVQSLSGAAYSFAGNVISYSFEWEGETITGADTLLYFTDSITIKQWYPDGDINEPLAATVSFKSKQDAIDFAATHGVDCSTYYDQLEQ
jgi:hypothetical protein